MYLHVPASTYSLRLLLFVTINRKLNQISDRVLKMPMLHPLLFRLLYFPDLHPGTIGEEKKILKAGDGYYVAPNLFHGCVCLEAGVLIDTFTPMREDFLK